MNRNAILIAFYFLLIFFFSRCKDDDDANIASTENRFELLKDKTWVLGTVQYDGTIITNEFDGFNIVFSGELGNDKTQAFGNYISKAGGEILPTGKNWLLPLNNDSTQMELYDRPTTYTVTDSTLDLTFTIPNGRYVGVPGEYSFQLKKEK